jgi:hypothetical protein
MVLCWMIAFFGWDAFGRNQSSSNERKLEEELLRRQWAEMEKEAEHRRHMEREGLKNRRDLTAPALPEEGY